MRARGGGGGGGGGHIEKRRRSGCERSIREVPMTRTAGGKEREKYDRELAEIQPFIDTIEITAQQHNSTTAGSRVHPGGGGGGGT